MNSSHFPLIILRMAKTHIFIIIFFFLMHGITTKHYSIFIIIFIIIWRKSTLPKLCKIMNIHGWLWICNFWAFVTSFPRYKQSIKMLCLVVLSNYRVLIWISVVTINWWSYWYWTKFVLFMFYILIYINYLYTYINYDILIFIFDSHTLRFYLFLW